jgi:hypothetical protein
MCLQFGFVIFWRKDFGAKAAHKMLVKLTPSVVIYTPEGVIYDVYSTGITCDHLIRSSLTIVMCLSYRPHVL